MNAKAQVVSAATGDSRLFALVRQFDANFHCMVGPPRAYFEIPADGMGSVTRVVYQTFKIAAQRDTPEDRDQLVDVMWKNYFLPVVEALKKRDPERVPEDTVLFWRKLPAFEPMDNGGLALRMRLCIPGFRVPGEHQYEH